MADVSTYWTNGSADNDLNTAGNWAGGAPGANDRAYFIADYNGVAGPTVDMASLTAIDLDLLLVGEGYTRTIGGSGSELDISADLAWYRGAAGKLWLKEGGGTTDLVLVDSTAADPLNHDCVALTGATFTQVDLLRGYLTLLTGVTVTTLNVGKFNSPSSEAKCVINAGTITVTNFKQYSGLTTNNQALTTVDIFGGIFSQALGVDTTVNVYGGRANLNTAGTYTNVRAYPGSIVDFSQSGGRKIVTNMYEYPGSTIIGRELLKVTNNLISV